MLYPITVKQHQAWPVDKQPIDVKHRMASHVEDHLPIAARHDHITQPGRTFAQPQGLHVARSKIVINTLVAFDIDWREVVVSVSPLAGGVTVFASTFPANVD